MLRFKLFGHVLKSIEYLHPVHSKTYHKIIAFPFHIPMHAEAMVLIHV